MINAYPRPVVEKELIEEVTAKVVRHVLGMMQKHGPGAIVSPHEALGLIGEEWNEVQQAVHDNMNVYAELVDLAAIAIFALASCDLTYQWSVTAQPHQDLLEKLASLEHEQWAHWTHYMLDNLTEENIERWRQQIKTTYSELSEKEKNSDREWANKILEIL